MTQTLFGGRGPGYVTAYTVAPSNTVAPAITGTTEEGDTLTCSTGTWLRASLTYAYQWKRAGVAIGGATAATHVLVTADMGVAIKCTVTATNAIGSASADSNEVTPAAAFTPASLFTGAVTGAWYDPSDLSSMFQNSGGTGAVAADGDPVGYITDKSGNGHHLIQATAAARPIYRTSGGLHWLEFDGVDDKLAGTVTGMGGSAFSKRLFVALDNASTPGGCSPAALGAGGGMFGVYISAGQLHSIVHWGSEPTGSAMTNNPEVWTATMNGANSDLRINGASDIAPTANGSGNIVSDNFALGEAVLAIKYVGRFFGLVFVAGNPDVADPETYLGAKMGIVI